MRRKRSRREEQAWQPDECGDCQTDGDGLHAGHGCAGGILFADAAGDHGGGGEAQAKADGEDQAEERFGEADSGDGVSAETADPENVDDSEQGLQDHLEDHGNGQEKDGAIEAAGGEVLVRAAERFADRTPKTGQSDSGGNLF